MTAKRSGPPGSRARVKPARKSGVRSNAPLPSNSGKGDDVPVQASPEPKTRPKDNALVVVGVGGSAGSLGPLRELFSALPVDAGIAFVVVSHQSATGHSLLPEILAKTTPMPVNEINGPTPLEGGHIYVVPRGESVALQDGLLSIDAVGDRRVPSAPIDFFFEALARDRRQRAVGIILSGTGRDGTRGLAAIRSSAGLCLAQAPETAEFDGMPSSAIAAQAAEFALKVSEMPDRLAAFALRASTAPLNGRDRSELTPERLEPILTLIRERAGHDFSAYKRDTLLRRVERRMDLHGVERLADYARFLDENDEEIDALWRDWLIGVSGFFRDPEAFKALADSGLRALLATRKGERSFRVWVPGCATGEEAYSVAIVILEMLESLGLRLDVQVFATDLDPTAITAARAGRYPKSIASAVGPERLARYFAEEGHGFRVKKSLRERIVFAVQDALSDPPFTRVDLVSCRNLLIYVVPSAQQTLLSVFHYCMNPGGLLLLGASEHVGESMDLFTVLDRRWKLYRRSDVVAPLPPVRWTPRSPHALEAGAARPRVESVGLDLTETLRTLLADRFGPPAVVVDFRGQIQQIHGRVGAYLELAPGRAHLNVVDMAREGLRAPLAAALRELEKNGDASVEKELRWKSDGAWRSLRLTVSRVQGRRIPIPLVLISFELVPGGAHTGRKRPSKERKSAKARLVDEVQQIRGDLEVSVSELQAANEELASANEEVQSANEELQSSNEELQSSKEETQSLNEELHTVNGELMEKLRGIEVANDDLLNLMSNIEIATIFLDDRMRVKRFTPQARSVARLIDGDVGRPLADLATLVDYPDLLADAGAVLASLRPIEKQVPAAGGAWYTVRIRPYRTARDVVEGLVVTFIDITETKRGERIQAARFLAESIVDAVREPLLVLDRSLRVLRANRSFYRVFQVGSAETAGRLVEEIGDRQWGGSELRSLLETTLRDGTPFEGFEVIYEFPQIGRRRVLLSGRPVSIADQEQPSLLVLGIEDTGPTNLPTSAEGATT